MQIHTINHILLKTVFLASLNVLAFRLTALLGNDFTLLNFAFSLGLREKLDILICAESFLLMFQI